MHRRLVILWTGLLAATAPAGCTDDATQLVVVVDTDIDLHALDSSPGPKLYEVRVRASDPVSGSIGTERTVLVLDRRRDETSDPSQTEVLVPFSFAVAPSEGGSGTALVEVSGFGPAGVDGDDLLATRTARVRFIEGKRLKLEMFLSNACVGVPCPDGETCIGGACESDVVDPTTLPTVSPGEELARDGGSTSMDGGEGTPGPDAGISEDGGAGCTWDYPPAFFDPCARAHPAPSPALTLGLSGEYAFDTDDGSLRDPAEGVAFPSSAVIDGTRVLSATGLSVGRDTTLRVVGNLPLLLAIDGNVEVRGTIDVSTFFDADADESRPGAGANPPACDAFAPETGQTCAQHGGSGGGGGGFGGEGGDGGDGGDGRECDSGLGVAGGRGGGSSSVPTSLRGGCPGADGGLSNFGVVEGRGGDGGGAIHIAASEMLLVTGTVHAGGGGGGGAYGDRGGGGGGGSGGLIGFEASDLEITATAMITANGGGGGGGSDGGDAGRGEDGRRAAAAAAGGPADGNGTDGGDGAWRDSPRGEHAMAAGRGGGGGGGGAGWILVFQQGSAVVDGAALFSPSPTTR